VRAWRRRLRALFHRQASDGRMSAELAFHLDMETEKNIRAGMDPAAARRAAVLSFGGVDRVSEEVRDVRNIGWLEDVTHDLRHAGRALRRSPGFALTAVITFALGIGANATMFGVIDHLLFRAPAHVVQPDRVVMLSMRGTNSTGLGQPTFNWPVYRILQRSVRSFDDVALAGYGAIDVPIGTGADAQSASGLLVTASYFTVLGVRPTLGRFIAPSEAGEPTGLPVVVISYGFWTRHFGNARNVIGTTIDIASQRYTVIGVAPKGFTGTELGEVDMWLPFTAALRLDAMPRQWATMTGSTYARVFARLRPDVTPARAADEVGRVLTSELPKEWYVNGRRALLTSLVQSRSAQQGGTAQVAAVLAAMSVTVLLIACANVANLLLARALGRRREIAVRLALGVSRSRLARMLLTESVLLALFGGAAALVVAGWGGGLIRGLLFGDITWVSATLDARLLVFTGFVAISTGLVAGLIPAVQASRPNVSGALKAGVREGGGQRTLTRNALLVVQAALSVVLLVGAGLFVRSLMALNATRMGVDPDRVLTASMKLQAVGRTAAESDEIYAQALARVRTLPGIAYAAAATTTPFGASWSTSLRVPGRDSLPEAEGPFYNAVGPGYFATLGTRLIDGREFTDADTRTSARVIVINATMARLLWPGRRAIGECIQVAIDSLPCATVVGVVEDVRRQNVFEGSLFFVHVPLTQDALSLHTRHILARPSGDARTMIESVRRTIQTAAPGLPFAKVQRIGDMADLVTQLRPWRLAAALFAAFGLLALVLAAVGLYGVVSYSVAQRIREMGVRVALGARRRDIAQLVVLHGAGVTAIGVALGVGVALVSSRFATPLLYHVSPRDPFVFGAVVVTLFLVSVAASAAPAWRATRVDPIEALRSE